MNWSRLTRVSLILGAALGLAYYFFFPRTSIYELSPGYRGPVVVFFNHPDGVSPKWHWASVTFQIGANGVLLVKDSPTRPPGLSFWLYRDASSTIPGDDDASATSGVVVRGVRFTSQDSGRYQWVEGRVGEASDPDSFGSSPHYIVDRIIDGLK